MGARALALMAAGSLGVACTGDSQNFQASTVSSCMKCHNGSPLENYAGPGIENPHPFGVTDMACTTCHGGNGAGKDKLASHVPPPPEIGDAEYLEQNRQAYFNRLTLTGIDKFADYTVDGQTYSAIDSYPIGGIGANGVLGRSGGTVLGGAASQVVEVGGRRLRGAPDWSDTGAPTIFGSQRGEV